MIAVIIISAAVCIILASMVMAWVVYSISTVKKQMVYTDELNMVIDQVNTLAHAVHRAYLRNSTGLDAQRSRIDDSDTQARHIQDRLDELALSVESAMGLQISQSNFIVQNQNEIARITQNPILSAGSNYYLPRAEFSGMFQEQLASPDSPLTLGASEIEIGDADVRVTASQGRLSLHSGQSPLQLQDGELYLCSSPSSCEVIHSSPKISR